MNNELKAIKMENRDERAHLATTTKHVDTLAWFSGDLDPVVLLAMVRNPLFDRHMFTRSPIATLVNKQLKKEKQESTFLQRIQEPFAEIIVAIGNMPKMLKKLAAVYFFQWYALFVYWQFITPMLRNSIYGLTNEDNQRFEAIMEACKSGGTVGTGDTAFAQNFQMFSITT